MRRLALHREAFKELCELQAKQYRQVVSAIFDLLKDPLPNYSKQLVGSEYRRIAVGEYRVVYRADDETVFVVAFGKRNDSEIYRALERKM
jgi:mRNA interferase RelE/StbE